MKPSCISKGCNHDGLGTMTLGLFRRHGLIGASGIRSLGPPESANWGIVGAFSVTFGTWWYHWLKGGCECLERHWCEIGGSGLRSTSPYRVCTLRGTYLVCVSAYPRYPQVVWDERRTVQNLSPNLRISRVEEAGIRPVLWLSSKGVTSSGVKSYLEIRNTHMNHRTPLPIWPTI